MKVSVKKLAQKSRADCMDEVNALFSCLAVRLVCCCICLPHSCCSAKQVLTGLNCAEASTQ